MHDIELHIQPCTDECEITLPRYMSAGASGLDICACLSEPITLKPFERALIPTGLRVSIPAGYEIQVRPRSGLAIKNGITLLNTPGTIDADYRGEVKIIVINLGSDDFIITHGMRIAQLVVAPVIQAAVQVVDELDGTPRSAGGFGHTGI